jgi:hypothetical protein
MTANPDENEWEIVTKAVQHFYQYIKDDDDDEKKEEKEWTMTATYF